MHVKLSTGLLLLVLGALSSAMAGAPTTSSVRTPVLPATGMSAPSFAAAPGAHYVCDAQLRSCAVGGQSFCCPSSSSCDFENSTCGTWN